MLFCDLFFAASMAAAQQEWAPYTDAFSRRFASIVTNYSLPDEVRVAAYLTLASEYPNHRRVAEVYVEAAKFRVDGVDDLELYEKARASSKRGSWIWRERQNVCAGLHWRRGDRDRAMALLDEMLAVCPDAEARSRVESFHFTAHVEKDEFDLAEVHLAKLIDLNRYENCVGLSHRLCAMVNERCYLHVKSYFGGIAQRPSLPVEQRLNRLRRFAEQHPSRLTGEALARAEETIREYDQLIKDTIEKNRKIVATKAQDGMPPAVAAVPAPPSGGGKLLWLAALGFGALAAGCLFLLRSRSAKIPQRNP